MRLSALFCAALLAGCSTSDAPAEPPKTETPAPEGETEYSCPMHPEITSAEPGSCSECGMDLVAGPKKPEEGHEGHGDHQDH